MTNRYRKKPAPHSGITHCDNCGCDWLDNGLNPIGCPYCELRQETKRRWDGNRRSTFAALIRNAALEEAIKVIEDYRIPVGNSAAGELACDWTRDALKDIRDAILALKKNSNGEQQ